MVECATFADDIKFKGGSYQKGWHFIDTPYLDEGGKISDYNFTFDDHNITEAISGIVDWFNQAPGYDQAYIYKTLMQHAWKGKEENAASTAMRLLIHYSGDIHQPLHCSSRVNHEYPKGDRGGNDFPLTPMGDIKELHAAWDSVLMEFDGYATLVSINIL